MKEKTLTTDDVWAARIAAESCAHIFETFQVDWTVARSDKRHGSIHGWTQHGAYLGQFTRHSSAIEQGAAVTRFSGVWFLWSTSPVRVPATERETTI
jgi:hypothetical protein